MKPAKIQEILQSNKKLSVKQVKEVIKYMCDMAEEDYTVETLVRAKGFHSGQVNAFYICLDLLEKVGGNNV